MDQYGVIGNPIAHSLSPFIHHAFALQTQQSLSYVPILVERNALLTAIEKFQARLGKGLNITAPFKQEAFDLVDTLTERARCARAVNTIMFLEDGSRLGDNTDGVGFIHDLKLNQRIDLKNKRILILGAGGAARGVIASILQEKPAVTSLLNRTEINADQLANDFANLGFVEVVNAHSLCERSYDIAINTMSHEFFTLPLTILDSDSICYDLTYRQEESAFMQWGTKEKAAICVNGLGMLVEQAAESYYLWRKIRPKTAPVLALLRQKGAKVPFGT